MAPGSAGSASVGPPESLAESSCRGPLPTFLRPRNPTRSHPVPPSLSQLLTQRTCRFSRPFSSSRRCSNVICVKATAAGSGPAMPLSPGLPVSDGGAGTTASRSRYLPRAGTAEGGGEDFHGAPPTDTRQRFGLMERSSLRNTPGSTLPAADLSESVRSVAACGTANRGGGWYVKSTPKMLWTRSTAWPACMTAGMRGVS